LGEGRQNLTCTLTCKLVAAGLLTIFCLPVVWQIGSISMTNRIFWWVRIKIDGQKIIQTLNPKKFRGRLNLKIIKRNLRISCNRNQIQKNINITHSSFHHLNPCRKCQTQPILKTEWCNKNEIFLWIKNQVRKPSFPM
jgi:hypothetical protein